MSMRQLCYQLDPLLNEIFNDDSLDSSEWFKKLEEVVKNNLPRRYQSLYEPHQVVLQYVRFKAMQND